MVIAHYAALQQSWGTTPYEVWISLDENTTSDDVYQWIQDNDIHVTKYENKEIDLRLVEEDPMLQGTNGVLTMGFIVTIILCAVGYLIYCSDAADGISGKQPGCTDAAHYESGRHGTSLRRNYCHDGSLYVCTYWSCIQAECSEGSEAGRRIGRRRGLWRIKTMQLKYVA